MYREVFKWLDEDGKEIGSIWIKGDDVKLWKKNGSFEMYKLSQLKAAGTAVSSEFSAGTGISGGILGAALLGPIGAAAGVALGRLLRECIFLMRFADGRQIVCKATQKQFDLFLGQFKIRGINIDAI